MRVAFFPSGFLLLAAFAGAGGCGDDGAANGAAPDAGGPDAVADAADAATTPDAVGGDADGGDAGLFVPGDPPTGSPELELFAAKTEDDLSRQSPVLQGDLLYWQCGQQAEGIGHVWASFRLVTAELDGLGAPEQAQIEELTKLQLVDQAGFVIAENEGLAFALDFSVPGELSIVEGAVGVRAVQMVLNRAVVGQTTRPSNVDQEIVRFRVTVPIPGGSEFTREVWVDTLVPPSQAGGC